MDNAAVPHVLINCCHVKKKQNNNSKAKMSQFVESLACISDGRDSIARKGLEDAHWKRKMWKTVPLFRLSSPIASSEPKATF